MKYRFRVVGFLFVLSIITFIDRVCISVAGKAIQEDLGLSLVQWGWVLSAFVISYGLFEVPAGAMGDRQGPRKVLTRIVTWWSVFTALTGMVHGFKQLVVVRFLFGAGEAGAFPNSSVVIARWFPVLERARAQSIVWMGSRVGAAISPLLVIPIQQAYGWRVSFFIFGAVGIVWAAAWYAWFRDDPATKPGVSASEIAEIGASGTAHASTPTPWRQLLSQGNLWWMMLAYHCQAWCAFFYITWLHIFLANGRGFTPQELIALSWLPFVFGALANLAGGIISDLLVRRLGLRRGRSWVGCGGLGLAAVFVAATLTTEHKVLTIVFLALAFGFSDLTLPVAWAVCLDIGHQHAGIVSGAMNMAGQLGSFLTTVLFGYIVSWSGSYDTPLVPIAVMSAFAALAWLRVDASRPLLVGPAVQPA